MIRCVVVIAKAQDDAMRKRDQIGRYSTTGGGSGAAATPAKPAKTSAQERVSTMRDQLDRQRTTAPSWDTAHPQGGELPADTWGTMTVKELDWHQRAFNHIHVPQAVVAAIRKAPSLQSIEVKSPEETTNSFYYPHRYSDNAKIVMRDGYPDDAYTVSVWCHEYGHHIDHTIGETQRSPKLSMFEVHAGSGGDALAIRNDGDRMVANTTHEDSFARYQRVYERIYKEFDAAQMYHLDRLASVKNDETRYNRAERAALQDLLVAHGFEKTDLDAIFAKNMIQAQAVIGCLAGLTAGIPQRAMTMMPRSQGMYAHVSDYLACMTRNRLHFASSHEDEYLNRGRPTAAEHYTEHHTTEVFANWFAAQGSRQRFWRTFLEKLTPSTHKAFRARVTAWLREETP